MAETFRELVDDVVGEGPEAEEIIHATHLVISGLLASIPPLARIANAAQALVDAADDDLISAVRHRDLVEALEALDAPVPFADEADALLTKLEINPPQTSTGNTLEANWS